MSAIAHHNDLVEVNQLLEKNYIYHRTAVNHHHLCFITGVGKTEGLARLFNRIVTIKVSNSAGVSADNLYRDSRQRETFRIGYGTKNLS